MRLIQLKTEIANSRSLFVCPAQSRQLHVERVHLALQILAFRGHSKLNARFRPGGVVKQEDDVANSCRNCACERTRCSVALGQQLPLLISRV